jgi:hypothetical protein
MISCPLVFLSLALLILLSFDGGVNAQETRGARRENGELRSEKERKRSEEERKRQAE